MKQKAQNEEERNGNVQCTMYNVQITMYKLNLWCVAIEPLIFVVLILLNKKNADKMSAFFFFPTCSK
jgi:hypothetical protein